MKTTINRISFKEMGTGGEVVILRVRPMAVSLAKSTATPGPSEGGYYVKITHVPEGVSPAQVILLFTHTARIAAEKGERYEFAFSELCPSVVFSTLGFEQGTRGHFRAKKLVKTSAF